MSDGPDSPLKIDTNPKVEDFKGQKIPVDVPIGLNHSLVRHGATLIFSLIPDVTQIGDYDKSKITESYLEIVFTDKKPSLDDIIQGFSYRELRQTEQISDIELDKERFIRLINNLYVEIRDNSVSMMKSQKEKNSELVFDTHEYMLGFYDDVNLPTRDNEKKDIQIVIKILNEKGIVIGSVRYERIGQNDYKAWGWLNMERLSVPVSRVSIDTVVKTINREV